MPRYVALLRGINVGGHRVKMDHLRALFGEIGFEDVETFIASGNVIFTSPAEDVPALESSIAGHLEDALGFEVPAIIRTPAELQAVVDIQGEEQRHPDHSVYVTFLRAVPDADLRNALEALESEMDRFEVRGREVYWLIRGKLSDSPLFKRNAVTKAMKGVQHTARNITSVRKLLDKHGPT